MSIHDRCWQCRFGEKSIGGNMRCSRVGPITLGVNCDEQRKSRNQKDCGREGQFFAHRDLHKVKELADA